MTNWQLRLADKIIAGPKPPDWDTLTDRQQECVRYLLAGMRLSEVAQAMGCEANTANTHIYAARKKLGVDGRFELLLLFLARRWRLV